ncbi:MAG: flagellar basal body protein [Chloroflexota bacterium]|nr:flagellar basal body protein [Chloroflexota bacterium]
MIKGLYSAYTSMEAAWRYQEILADNIANATTVGFKREVAAAQALPSLVVAQQEPVPAPLPTRIQQVIGQVGTGQFLAELQAPGSRRERSSTLPSSRDSSSCNRRRENASTRATDASAGTRPATW